MKRGTTIALIALFVLLSGFFVYRGYRASADRDRVEKARIRSIQEAEEERLEARRRAEAESEAKRLADLKARQDTEEAANRLAAAQKERQAAEAARLAAAEDAKRLAAEQDRIRAARDAAALEARQQQELRDKEAREAEEKRLAAIKALEGDRKAQDEREATRLAALRRQQELEALAPHARFQAQRVIYSEDYKRRQHYYLELELMNAGRVGASPGVSTPVRGQ